jgi:proteic killer suppression protein
MRYYNLKGYSMLWSQIIDISWSNHQLEKACSSDKAGRRKWGSENWAVLKRRLFALEATPTLALMAGQPGRFHMLSADRSGDFALDLRGAQRLIFAPSHDPVPTLSDGGVDTSRVTAIVVKEVTDYHGR